MTPGADFKAAATRMRTQRRQAEQREVHYHEARILLLISQFTTAKGGLTGLTKLAKLDFLLRYPAMLERLLPAGQASWPAGTAPTPPERLAVESRMTRYKYRPWDQRYYSILGSLAARALITYGDSARAEFRVTEQGAAVAASLAATPEWAVVASRIKLLKRHFNKSGSALKNLIYDRLPDAVDRPWRTEI
ncbi:hypothetical protein [Streptomyces brasiliensis]|uniref:Uncharacterized protein n=1 Tax=Streptomyces brasiliensis TaxID=1954 RepID=A0A917PBG5_9ACTN|nr:hypothetical protein [Streptomyces brasiliensis]GGJ69696.1 hypothetical protein GCM10010121_095470 [Streptomyces brasiliensis]